MEINGKCRLLLILTMHGSNNNSHLKKDSIIIAWRGKNRESAQAFETVESLRLYGNNDEASR